MKFCSIPQVRRLAVTTQVRCPRSMPRASMLAPVASDTRSPLRASSQISARSAGGLRPTAASTRVSPPEWPRRSALRWPRTCERGRGVVVRGLPSATPGQCPDCIQSMNSMLLPTRAHVKSGQATPVASDAGAAAPMPRSIMVLMSVPSATVAFGDRAEQAMAEHVAEFEVLGRGRWRRAGGSGRVSPPLRWQASQPGQDCARCSALRATGDAPE
jgi:hypothetical protein